MKAHILNSQCFCTILVFLFTFFHAGSFCSRQGPAGSTNPLSRHVLCCVGLCGAQGTNPSRLSGTAFSLPCCAYLGEGTSNSFTLFTPLAWKLLVSGHNAQRLDTLSLQDSNICSTTYTITYTDPSPGGREEGSTKQDPQNNVPNRDPSMVACRKCVGQLLGLDCAHYQNLKLI